jgi:hypothetical protein
MKSNHAHIRYKINNRLFPFQHVSPFHKITYKEKCLENIPRYRSASSWQLAAPYTYRHQNMFSKQASLEGTLLKVETQWRINNHLSILHLPCTLFALYDLFDLHMVNYAMLYTGSRESGVPATQQHDTQPPANTVEWCVAKKQNTHMLWSPPRAPKQ